MTRIKLGVPSKGRLQEKVIEWFAARGVTITRTGGSREYAGAVSGIEGIDLVLLSAGEIPKALKNNDIDIGVTGQDLIQERLHDWESVVTERVRMGFGFADLVLAVPVSWVDVNTLDDLDAVAADFRENQGFRLRIATSYHRLVREFMYLNGIANYQLVDSQGATEGTVANLTAEMIADITSSGETIRANHLKTLGDALILQSQACLFEAVRDYDETARGVLDRLYKTLDIQ